MPRYNISPNITGTGDFVFGGKGGRLHGTDQALLGRLNEGGPSREVFFDVNSESVVAFFGKRGTGKSYSMGVLAEGLCAAPGDSGIGSNTGSKAVLLLDTIDVFWSTALPFDPSLNTEGFTEEQSRLRRWRITPPDLDVAVYKPSDSYDDIYPDWFENFSVSESGLSTDDLIDLFEFDPISPVGQLTMEAWGLSSESNTGPNFTHCLGLIENDPDLIDFYAETTRRAVRQRMRFFSGLSIFEPIGTALTELLVPGRLTVLELGGLDASIRTIVASILMRQIRLARQRASAIEKQLALNIRIASDERDRLTGLLAETIPPTWVMIDEAQNILPSDKNIKSLDSVVRFVREGRNFGLSFALTAQQPSSIDARIMAQADTIVCHQLTVQSDIARMRDNMKSNDPAKVSAGSLEIDLGGWLRGLDKGHAIVTNTDTARTFAIEIRPRICAHGGTGFSYQPTS
jgi:uncharacterized protein